MVKARELVAMQQIDFAVKTLQSAVKELGLENLEAGTVTMRIRDEGRSFMEGVPNEKGKRLQEFFEQSGYAAHSKNSDTRPVKEMYFTKEGICVYCDIAYNPLDKLKAEQERIAAEIAKLEGEQHGAS